MYNISKRGKIYLKTTKMYTKLPKNCVPKDQKIVFQKTKKFYTKSPKNCMPKDQKFVYTKRPQTAYYVPTYTNDY
jgi:hypothetical protein